MRRRYLTILAGLACLAVIVFGAATVYREIWTRYHLGLLRSDPGYFAKILSKPEGTHERVSTCPLVSVSFSQSIRESRSSIENQMRTTKERTPPGYDGRREVTRDPR